MVKKERNGLKIIMKLLMNTDADPHPVTPIYSRSLERKKNPAFCVLQIFLSGVRTT